MSAQDRYVRDIADARPRIEKALVDRGATDIRIIHQMADRIFVEWKSAEGQTSSRTGDARGLALAIEEEMRR